MKKLLFYFFLIGTNAYSGNFKKVPALVDLCTAKCAETFLHNVTDRNNSFDWDDEKSQEYLDSLLTKIPLELTKRIATHCSNKGKQPPDIKHFCGINKDHSLFFTYDKTEQKINLQNKNGVTETFGEWSCKPEIYPNSDCTNYICASGHNFFHAVERNSHDNHKISTISYSSSIEPHFIFKDNENCLFNEHNTIKRYRFSSKSNKEIISLDDASYIKDFAYIDNYIACLTSKNILGLFDGATGQKKDAAKTCSSPYLLISDTKKQFAYIDYHTDTVKIIRIESDRLVSESTVVSPKYISSHTFSVDGKYLATYIKENNSVTIWDIASKKSLMEIVFPIEPTSLHHFTGKAHRTLFWATDNNCLIVRDRHGQNRKAYLGYCMLAQKLNEYLAKNSKT